MAKILLSKKSFIPALYFKLMNLETSNNTITSYTVALCPDYFGHFLIVNKRMQVPPKTTMIFHGYATSDTDLSTVVPYRLDMPNSELIGRYIVVTMDGGVSIRKDFKFVSVMRRKVNPEKWGIKVPEVIEDPLAEIEDLNVKLSQENINNYFKRGDSIRCIRNKDYGDLLTIGKIYVVTDDQDSPTNVNIINNYDDDRGYYPNRFEKVNVDPLAEIEDLNIRLSQKEFKSGDIVKCTGRLASDSTHLKVGDRYEITGVQIRSGAWDWIYLKEIGGEPFLSKYFEILYDDPLLEIEDLNVRLSQREPKFKVGDRVILDSTHKYFVEEERWGLKPDKVYTITKVGAGGYGRVCISPPVISLRTSASTEWISERFKFADEDPLAEIEDLNVRLSQRDPKFKVGDKVRVDPMCEWVSVWTNHHWGLSLDKVYTVQEKSNYFNDTYYITLGVPRDAGGWSEKGFIAVDEDPLSEIEDLNVRLSNSIVFKPGDWVQTKSNISYNLHGIVRYVGTMSYHSGNLVGPSTSVWAVWNDKGRSVMEAWDEDLQNRSHMLSFYSTPEDLEYIPGHLPVNEDPLSEIEDLNVRLSQRSEFEVGDLVRCIEPSYSVSHGTVYEVIKYYTEGSAEFVTLLRDDGGKSTDVDRKDYLARRFELVSHAQADPLAEIEDLNIKLSQITNIKPGDKFRMKDSYLGNFSSFDGCEGIVDRVEGDKVYSRHWVFHYRDGHEEIDTMDGYEEAKNLEIMTPIDPLAEIEDLNVRLSNNKFKVGDIVKCIGHGKTAWDRCDWIAEGHVAVGGLYKVTRVHKPGDSDDLSGMNRDGIKIESMTGVGYYAWWFHTDYFERVDEDPLAEIEDLNIIMSRQSVIFKVGDWLRTKVGYSDTYHFEGIVRYIGELQGSGQSDDVWSRWNDRVVEEWDNQLRPASKNGQLTRILAEHLEYIPGHETLADPLAEIEDLNVRLSRNIQAEDFSCVLLEVDKQNSIYDKIKDISKKIRKEDLSEDGREDALHVTLKYGLDTEDPEILRPLLDNEGKIKVKIEKLDCFDDMESKKDFDVVVLRVDSEQMQKLHAIITDTFKDSGETHDNYKPHITLAYVKKGLGKKYVKELKEEAEDLVGKEIVFKEATFSTPEEKKTKIELSRYSSVIDHPKEHLDSLVWNKDNNIQETVKQEILLGLEQAGVPYKRVYVVGSIATLRWREDSDIDVTVLPDLREDNIKDLTKSVLKTNGDEKIGEHPINYYIREDLSPDNYSAVYDIIDDEWIKEEDTNVSVLDDVIDEVRTWARRIASNVEDYHMDVIDLDVLKSSLNERGVDKKELGGRIDRKLIQIEDDISIITSDYDAIHQQRRKDFESKLKKGTTISKEYLPSNLIYKYLERYGLIDIMQAIRKIGKDNDKTEIKLSRHIKADLESKLPILIKRYPDKTPEEAQERIRMLNQADPTGEYGEYTPWIVRLDVNKTSKFPEDTEIVKEGLKLFSEIKKNPNDVIYQALRDDDAIQLNPDIYVYKTYSDLSRALEPYKETRQRYEPPEYDDTNSSFEYPADRVVYKDATYKVLQLTDARVVAKLCKGANWCVKDVETANDYISTGPLVLVYKNDSRYVLIHQNEERTDYNFDNGDWAGEFKDRFNREASQQLYDELNPLIHDYIPSKYHIKFSALSSQEIDAELDSHNFENDMLYMYQKLSSEQIDYALELFRGEDRYDALDSLIRYQKLTSNQIDYLLDNTDEDTTGVSFYDYLFEYHQLTSEQIDKAIDQKTGFEFLLTYQRNIKERHIDKIVGMLGDGTFSKHTSQDLLIRLNPLQNPNLPISSGNRDRIKKIQHELYKELPVNDVSEVPGI